MDTAGLSELMRVVVRALPGSDRATQGLSKNQRVMAIQRLVRVAASNATALDTVLARLVLAACPTQPDDLRRLVDRVKGRVVVPMAQPEPRFWWRLNAACGLGGGDKSKTPRRYFAN